MHMSYYTRIIFKTSHGYTITAVAILHKTEILKHVAAGNKISDIGKSYDVTRSAISKQLLSDPEWVDT